MKTWIAILTMTLVQVFAHSAAAYILPLDFILQKSSGLAGNSIISVEQEVRYKDGPKTYAVRENWLIEGDRNLKVTVKGVGELKDAVNAVFLYNNKTRTSVVNKQKLTKTVLPDFFERYLSIKSKESYMGYIKELGLGEDVRLSRAGGTVCFAIGNVSTANDVQPHIWIDQNSFRLTKMRFPGKAEVEFGDYIEKDGIHYPKLKTVSWDGKSISIAVIKVTTKSGATIKNFYPETLEASNPSSLAAFGSAGAALEEFYSRFR